MKRWLLLLILFLLLPRGVFAAGTVTVATATISDQAHVYKRYTVSWTSTAGGAVSGNAFAIVAGSIVQIRFAPNTAATQPSDLYDLTLVETGGVADLTLGQGANLSNTVVTAFSYDPPFVQDGTRTLDVVIANAGNAKTGTVVILVQVR